MPSLLLAFISYFMLVVVNTVVIPTSEKYAQLLGGNSAFSGLSIAAVCVMAAVVGAPVAGMIVDKFGLKATFIGMASFGILGNVMYALGMICGSRWVVLGGRIVCGIAGPSNPMSIYINRGVSVSNRTGVMTYLSVVCSAGYSAGPFLAFALIELATNFPSAQLITSGSSNAYEASAQPVLWKLFNQFTYPGWLCAVMYAVFIPLVVVFFKEPPIPPVPMDRATEEKEKEEAISLRERFHSVFCNSWSAPLYCSMFVMPLIFSGIEVMTIRIAGDGPSGIWKLKPSYAALFLGMILLATVFSQLLSKQQNQRSHRCDRELLLSFLLVTIIFLALGFIPLSRTVERAIGVHRTHGTGAKGDDLYFLADMAIYLVVFVCVFTASNMAKAMTMALIVKLPEERIRNDVIGVSSFFYMLNRGMGSLIASAVPPFAMLVLLLVLTVVVAVLVWCNYSSLSIDVEDSDSDSDSGSGSSSSSSSSSIRVLSMYSIVQDPGVSFSAALTESRVADAQESSDEQVAQRASAWA